MVGLLENDKTTNAPNNMHASWMVDWQEEQFDKFSFLKSHDQEPNYYFIHIL